MNLEDQVISLNLARRLKELNVPQESLFIWHYESEKSNGVRFAPFSPLPMIADCSIFMLFSAFSVAELMNIVPPFIDIGEHYAPFNNHWLEIKKRSAENIRYIARYVCDPCEATEITNPHFQPVSGVKSYDEKLADCLAKLLINLIENGLMPV